MPSGIVIGGLNWESASMGLGLICIVFQELCRLGRLLDKVVSLLTGHIGKNKTGKERLLTQPHLPKHFYFLITLRDIAQYICHLEGINHIFSVSIQDTAYKTFVVSLGTKSKDTPVCEFSAKTGS